MLMNLTRMRKFGWEMWLGPLLHTCGRDISWGDQDLLNTLFSAHRERLLLISYQWNYWTYHCMYGAYSTGGPPAVIHESRKAFISDSEPAFRELHKAMEQYELGESLEYSFVFPYKDALGRSRKKLSVGRSSSSKWSIGRQGTQRRHHCLSKAGRAQNPESSQWLH
ncbi:hypothetical protein MTO96_042569 [Rhipicephalus appendiculatus]